MKRLRPESLADDLTWRCLAHVLRVIDGDTFSADFDVGFGLWLREVKGKPNRVRILGLNTPERGEPRYLEAAELLTAILGPRVWVTSIRLDSFGRSLANVRTEAGLDVRSQMPVEWQV